MQEARDRLATVAKLQITHTAGRCPVRTAWKLVRANQMIVNCIFFSVSVSLDLGAHRIKQACLLITVYSEVLSTVCCLLFLL